MGVSARLRVCVCMCVCRAGITGAGEGGMWVEVGVLSVCLDVFRLLESTSAEQQCVLAQLRDLWIVTPPSLLRQKCF